MNRFLNSCRPPTPQLFRRPARPFALPEATPEDRALQCITCGARGFTTHKALDRHGREKRHQACERKAA